MSDSSVVKVHSPKERLTISSGILQAGPPCDGGAPYRSPSWIPREPWNELPPESDAPPEPGPPDPSRTVSLIRLSPKVLESFQDAGFAEVRGLEDAELLDRAPRTHAAIRSLAEEVVPFLRSKAAFAITAVVPKPPGLRTLTSEREPGSLRIGLHLDSWQRAPLDARDHSSNRLCVNLGTEDRYLLFIPRTVRGLCADLSLGPRTVTPPQLVETYLLRHPAQPVYRLRVSPGEAYIAPTENILHDGSTEGQSRLDLTLTLRGFWAVQPIRPNHG